MGDPCKTCKHYSLLNAFCELEETQRDPNYDQCFKHKEPSKKCDDCTNDSCDGNCDCGGKCKDKDEKKDSGSGCGYAGGCGGSCPGGGCTSLASGVNALDWIDISSPANYKWEYLLEDGTEREMGKIEVKVYSHNTTQYTHHIDATVGSVTMKNFYFHTAGDIGFLSIEVVGNSTKITIKRA